MDAQASSNPDGDTAGLIQALYGPSIRRTTSDRPLVYGYASMDAYRPSHPATCRAILAEYCQRQALELGTVFVDTATDGSQLIRPGLAGLYGALALPDSYAAVIIHGGHLSWRVDVARLLVYRIRTTGAKLLVINGSVPDDQPLPNDPSDVTAATVPEVGSWW